MKLQSHYTSNLPAPYIPRLYYRCQQCNNVEKAHQLWWQDGAWLCYDCIDDLDENDENKEIIEPAYQDETLCLAEEIERRETTEPSQITIPGMETNA